jgi:hypothetical protein
VTIIAANSSGQRKSDEGVSPPWVILCKREDEH